MLIELPPLAAPSEPTTEPEQHRAVEPRPARPQVMTPVVEIPTAPTPTPEAVPVPIPTEPTTTQITREIEPITAAPTESLPPAPTGAGSSSDPKAQRQQADYFGQVSAHLNRRKKYPADAKKARQQGIVVVRFTVHRDGSVSDASIKHSSGHQRLDQATLDLLQLVAPLPRIPSSLHGDSVTLSLPIDYSLRIN